MAKRSNSEAMEVLNVVRDDMNRRFDAVDATLKGIDEKIDRHISDDNSNLRVISERLTTIEATQNTKKDRSNKFWVVVSAIAGVLMAIAGFLALHHS